jgi:hypothetical protein
MIFDPDNTATIINETAARDDITLATEKAFFDYYFENFFS